MAGTAPSSLASLREELHKLRVALRGRWRIVNYRAIGYELIDDRPLSPAECEANAIGSFHDAIEACGELHKSGKRPAVGGYFGR